jgi:hypothetical protein
VLRTLVEFMHKHVTYNKCYATGAQFADVTFGNSADFHGSVIDNFRAIKPGNFQVTM